MTLEEKETYLLKSSYKASDIMVLADVSQNQATAIMRTCRVRFGGSIKARPRFITAESFWKFNNSSIEREMKLLGIAKKELEANGN